VNIFVIKRINRIIVHGCLDTVNIENISTYVQVHTRLDMCIVEVRNFNRYDLIKFDFIHLFFIIFYLLFRDFLSKNITGKISWASRAYDPNTSVIRKNIRKQNEINSKIIV